MFTTLHVVLALCLTAFLACQLASLVSLLRSRRAVRRPGRPAELIWTMIPVAIVVFLAARSWLVVLELPRSAVASAVVATEDVPRPASETPEP